jgi:ABC-type transporter Mla MlaB component
MVFSLFRRKSTTRGAHDAADDAGIAVEERSGPEGGADSGPSLSERELGRLTAEKIDQIESEMISDALAAGVDELEAQAMGIGPGPASRLRKPTAVELLGELARKEERRASGLPPETQPAPEVYSAVELPAAPRHGPASATADSRADEPDTRAAEADSLGQTTTLAGEDPLAIEIVDGAMPEALEESAILFSNGNFAGALEALQRAMAGQRLGGGYRILGWHMLFDLLRVTGDREAFESTAIAYANETESSPPTWNDDLRAPDKPRPRGGPSHLTIRGVVDARTGSVVDQLQRAAGHKRECRVDFGEAQGMEPDGARQVLRLIDVFGSGSWPVRIDGARRLFELARAEIETGRRDDDDAYWQLALVCLRLLGDEARFDDLSIDFCVTYEISPPSWSPLPDTITAGDDEEGDTEAPVSANVVTAAGPRNPNRLVLSGELVGRVDEVVAALNEVAESHEMVTVDCLPLRRVDFTAAGGLLNLLIQFQGKGRQLVFLQPNYMVYALMLVMGMQELSTIRRRRI